MKGVRYMKMKKLVSVISFFLLMLQGCASSQTHNGTQSEDIDTGKQPIQRIKATGPISEQRAPFSSSGSYHIGKATVRNITAEVVGIIQPEDAASQLKTVTEVVVSISNSSSKDISITEQIALITSGSKKVYPASFEEIFPQREKSERQAETSMGYLGVIFPCIGVAHIDKSHREGVSTIDAIEYYSRTKLRLGRFYSGETQMNKSVFFPYTNVIHRMEFSLIMDRKPLKIEVTLQK